MESIIGHKIDYNGGGGSERPAAPIQQKLTQVPTPRSKKAPYLPHSGLFTKDDNSSSPSICIFAGTIYVSSIGIETTEGSCKLTAAH